MAAALALLHPSRVEAVAVLDIAPVAYSGQARAVLILFANNDNNINNNKE